MIACVCAARETDVQMCPADESCWSEWEGHRTLVQPVTEGHFGQLHLRPWVVQDPPAPLERAEDTLLLELGFGTGIQPGTHNTSHTSVLHSITQRVTLGKELRFKIVEATLLNITEICTKSKKAFLTKCNPMTVQRERFS